MVRTFLVAVCLGTAAWAGKDPGADGLRWSPSWNAAVEEARALNLPIVLHRHGFY